MFDFLNQPTRLHRFVADHAEALQNASLLLGGASLVAPDTAADR